MVKQIHLNFFEMSCNSAHMGIGMWKLPGDMQPKKDTIEYYTWLAKLAEKGKITGIFFADVYGVDEIFPGQMEAQFRAGANCAQMDPIVWVSAMASVTKSVNFGITGSTGYLNPFILARTYSTLDHATKGRIAWNVVTSYSTSAAKANGLDSVTPHDQRYEKAHEFMDICYALWEGSWEDEAEQFSVEKNEAYDPTKIHRINYTGKHHKTAAIGATHPSPQRTPVLFQAGASSAGKDFAGKHAEAIFMGGANPADAGNFVKEVRDIAEKYGRDRNHVKMFPQMAPIIGRTVEEAEAKYEKYKACLDYRGGLAKLSQYTNVDLLGLPHDEPINLTDIPTADNTIHAVINGLKKKYGSQPITPRFLGENMAFCGFGPRPVGTPEMVADVIEEWATVGDVDGFNVAYISNPGSYEDVVELLVPELQRRGLMWKDYAVPGGTYRENLLNIPGHPTPPEGHPASRFRYEELKEKYADEHGDIFIDKRDPIASQDEKTMASKVEAVELKEQQPAVKASA